MSTLFQPSTLTFALAKQYVAEQWGKQGTPEMLARAGRAIQQAIKEWNQKDWRWLVKDAADIPVVANTQRYDLPGDFRDVYTARLTGATQRTLYSGTRREYDRVAWNQLAPGTAVAYDVLYAGSAGQIELLPVPNANNTLSLKYYRKLAVPMDEINATGTFTIGALSNQLTTADLAGDGIQLGAPIILDSNYWGTVERIVNYAPFSTSLTLQTAKNLTNLPLNFSNIIIGGEGVYLDIPAQYEWDIMATAVSFFLLGIPGVPADRLALWERRSAKGIMGAEAEQNNIADLDIAFEPQRERDIGLWNPNLILE